MNKKERELLFASIIEAALAKAQRAGDYHQPRPMNLTDGVNQYHVPDGMCGFAWVKLKPATSSFARWLKALPPEHKWRDQFGLHEGYPSGLDIWCRGFDQSWERKRAWAKAFAAVLTEHGFKAYAGDRLD